MPAIMPQEPAKLRDALWRIYRRADPPLPWERGGTLPWNDPRFSERMLAEHLDQSHGAASRTAAERSRQLSWFWEKLGLKAGDHVLDFTCGPGLYAVELAKRGCLVTGVDFSPASIAYARALAEKSGVENISQFVEQDVREVALPRSSYDAALLIYGQLAVFPREEAFALLSKIAGSLKPGARLVVELLNQDRVDKQASTWWFTDDQGLWGETPFLHLGERYWLDEQQTSVERYFIIDLESHEMLEVSLCDQTYRVQEVVELLERAGFSQVEICAEWGGLDLYDAGEWVVYVAEK
jgi:ubiquinone/menaquinone biosynthesis C-methylase UbiE